MKKKIVLALVIIGIVIFINSCGDLLGTSVSKADRIGMFEEDLNNTDRTGIWENFSELHCADYESIRDLAYWDTTSVFKNTNWDIEIPSNLSLDIIITTGTHTSGSSGNIDLKFEMVNEGDSLLGDNWKILKLWVETIDGDPDLF